MGIRFTCPNGHKLNVKGFLAGKRGVCPHCGAKVRIPSSEALAEDSETTAPPPTGIAAGAELDLARSAAPQQRPGSATATAIPQTAARDSASTAVPQANPTGATRSPVTPTPAQDPIAEAPDSVWYVRPSSGGQFGPATGEVMQGWLQEGRVGPDSLVWREGWEDWQVASNIFPQWTAESPPADLSPLPGPGPVQSVVQGPSAPVSRRSSNNMALVTVIVLGVLSIALLVVLFIIMNGS